MFLAHMPATASLALAGRVKLFSTCKWRLMLAVVLLAATAEALVPAAPFAQPVQGASRKDWNPDSVWHPHWGASVVHKGIDIFARRGTPVFAAQAGLAAHVLQGPRALVAAIRSTVCLTFRKAASHPLITRHE